MSQFGYTNPIAVPQRGAARTNAAAAVKTIPFDYVFQFALTGTRGNKVQDVLEISTEGVFVALSVGYSLVLDELRTPRTFPPVIDPTTVPQVPVVIPFFSSTTTFDGFIVIGMPGAEIAILGFTSPAILATVRTGADGIATVPLNEAPTVLRAWDRTNNLLSELFVAGTQMTPVIGLDPTTKRLPAADDRTVFAYGSPGNSINLFLFRTTSAIGELSAVNDTPIPLTTADTLGRHTGRVAIPLGTQLLPGDALLVNSPGEGFDPFTMFTVPRPRPSTVTLGALAAGLERIGADLTRGFRLNSNFARLFEADLPQDRLAPGTLDRAFETGSVAAEEASFLYSLDVGNTGREYQSKPIHNIAGLGIANGDRPFRPFAKPVMFEPRSSVRIQVEELSGPPGTLFIVLQGYKMLGTGRIPV